MIDCTPTASQVDWCAQSCAKQGDHMDKMTSEGCFCLAAKP